MKYKVGDEVFVKAKIVERDSGYGAQVQIVGVNGLIGGIWFPEEELIPADKTYTQGLADAWELAKKIYDMTCTQIEKIFDVDGGFWNVVREITVEEALAKIEAYEKKKEIKVGDVVYYSDGEYESTKSIVTRIHGDLIYTVYPDGSCGQEHNPSELKKTGKHIDIESLLKQIGE